MTTRKKGKEKKEEAGQKTATDPQVPAVREEAQPPARLEPLSVEVDKYRGVSQEPLPESARQRLLAPINSSDVEIRPDGILYFPEIKYRRVLNEALGPGGWALVPRSSISLEENVMSRDYALFCLGRFISEARGQMEYQPDNKQMSYPDAAEGVKSNALMRCCKDIGIASELWDPNFIYSWLDQYAIQVWVEGKQRPQWRRKDRQPFWQERGPVNKPTGDDPKPSQETKQEAKGSPRTHALTKTHLELKGLVQGFVKGKNLPRDPTKEILIRLTTWTDRDQKTHAGVDDYPLMTEKQASWAIKRYKEALKQRGKKQGPPAG